MVFFFSKSYLNNVFWPCLKLLNSQRKEPCFCASCLLLMESGSESWGVWLKLWFKPVLILLLDECWSLVSLLIKVIVIEEWPVLVLPRGKKVFFFFFCSGSWVLLKPETPGATGDSLRDVCWPVRTPHVWEKMHGDRYGRKHIPELQKWRWDLTAHPKSLMRQKCIHTTFNSNSCVATGES